MADSVHQIQSIPGFCEPFNALSHLIGAVVFGVLAWSLLRRGRGDARRVASLALFAFACVFALSMSGVYHLLEFGGTGRLVLRRMDHAAIFLLIAGTFTPIHAILFGGVGRWGMLAFIWTAAILGIVLKSVFFHSIPPWLHVIPYIALGWLGLISAITLYRSRGWAFVRPLVWGGIGYTLGAACLGLVMAGDPMIIPGVVGRHELFHVGVLVGMGLHWKFIHSFADEAMVPRKGHSLAI